MNRIRLAGLLGSFLLLAAGQPATGQDHVSCIFGDAPKPTACVLTDVVEQGDHRMTFTAARQRATFVGRRNSGWWSGRLNGKPAMGYEINRGHTAYSSLDLQNRFEWWSAGSGPLGR